MDGVRCRPTWLVWLAAAVLDSVMVAFVIVAAPALPLVVALEKLGRPRR